MIFEGTVTQKQCGMGTLRPAGKVEDLTSILKTSRDVFATIASCMAEEHEEEAVGIEQAYNCSQEEEETEEADLPTVPHTRHIWLGDHMPYALVDTRAGPNLVKEAWLDKAMPDWRRHLDQTGATTTRFKLADGGKSATPAGRITLDLTMGVASFGSSSN